MKSPAHISDLLLCKTILLGPLKKALKNLDFLFYCLQSRPVLFWQHIYGMKAHFNRQFIRMFVFLLISKLSCFIMYFMTNIDRNWHSEFVIHFGNGFLDGCLQVNTSFSQKPFFKLVYLRESWIAWDCTRENSLWWYENQLSSITLLLWLLF